MILQRLHVHFAIWISLLVIGVAGVLTLLLVLGARVGLDEVHQASVSHLHDAMDESARNSLVSLTETLSDNLVNPLYDRDMLQMRQLLGTTLQLANISATHVFEPNGEIINDGIKSLPSYGQPVADDVLAAFNSSAGGVILLERDDELVAVRAVRIGDELLGGVEVCYDLSTVARNTRAMTGRLENVALQNLDRNQTTAIITTGLMLLIVLPVTILMALRLSRPIRTVAKQVNEVRQGRYNVELASTNISEIYQLTTSVKQMTETIATTTVSRNYLTRVIDSMHEGLTVVDDKFRIEIANRTIEGLYRCDAGELHGQLLLDLIEPAENERIRLWLDRVADTRMSSSIETAMLTRRGEVIPMTLTAAPLRDDDAQSSLVCVFQDISRRRKQEERIRYLAHYDSLTGLPNRDLFFDRLQHAMKLTGREDHLLALLYIDIDFFKKINDSMGHAAGDLLLRQVADRLRKCVRNSDTVARMGGDEFTIILEPLQCTDDAIHVAEKLLDSVSQRFEVDRQQIFINLSIGIVFYPMSDLSAADLVQQADLAMYQAKEHGRGRYSLYESRRNGCARDRLAFENELRLALKRGQFGLRYQPQIDIRTGRCVGFEALLSWQHPDQGEIAPREFVQLLEDLGLIDDVGDWVLRQVCVQLAEWNRTRSTRVAINLSARQLRNETLSERIAACLHEYDVDPACLELEITEGSLIADIGQTEATLKELATLGVSIAIDDFGTGYSSLSYLHSLPITALKVDRSFIIGLPQDNAAEAITRTIIAMARSLNLRVVAEGVETEAQFALLREMDVHEVQGWFSGRPLLAAEAGSRLEKKGVTPPPLPGGNDAASSQSPLNTES